MPDKSVKELSKLLMEKAKKTLSYIPSYIELGDYNTAINRSYYSAFYSMKAIEYSMVLIQKSIRVLLHISEANI